MAWQQVKAFDIKKMGTRAGWCLQNTRLGFGINVGKYPSAKADMEAQKKGGTLHAMPAPSNVAVPVYVDTSSQYEHVMVCDKGTYYSDGKRLSSVNGMRFFGWGELCDGVRVVKKVSDPTPSTSFKVGDKVTLTKWVDYNNKPLAKTRDYYTISELRGNRAVLKAGNTVYAAVNTANLKVYSTSSTGFLPSKGYWKKGDNDAKVATLAAFMRQTFPAYTSAKALGSTYNQYLEAAIKEFQRRTGLNPDGITNKATYEKLRQYGFKG